MSRLEIKKCPFTEERLKNLFEKYDYVCMARGRSLQYTRLQSAELGTGLVLTNTAPSKLILDQIKAIISCGQIMA